MFEAVHVLVHVAPAPHVAVEPAPTVTVQLLPASHATLADAPATSVHVACDLHSRFALSPALIAQLLCAAHSVSHEPPHEPVHVAPEAHSRLHPVVCALHAPVPLKLHCPAPAHEHFVPVHAAGTPALDVDPDDPHATPSATITKQTNADLYTSELLLGGLTQLQTNVVVLHVRPPLHVSPGQHGCPAPPHAAHVLPWQT